MSKNVKTRFMLLISVSLGRSREVFVLNLRATPSDKADLFAVRAHSHARVDKNARPSAATTISAATSARVRSYRRDSRALGSKTVLS